MCFKSDKTSFPIKHRVLPRLTSVSKVPHVGMEYFYVALSWKSSWMAADGSSEIPPHLLEQK